MKIFKNLKTKGPTGLRLAIKLLANKSSPFGLTGSLISGREENKEHNQLHTKYLEYEEN